jgi:hypothetical protein
MTYISRLNICLIIMNSEVFERLYERREARIKERHRSLIRFFHQLFSKIARQTPTEYNEESSMSQGHAKALTKAHNSWTLPQYESLRKHQISEEGENLPSSVGGGKAQ